MIPVPAYAAPAAGAPLSPWKVQRRDPGPDDVLIDILYCGICHSDIHASRGEWGPAAYPMVPGHEIVGRVARVGAKVKRFKPGDLAGVGCFTDSCRTCGACKKGMEQYCEKGQTVFTYNDTEKDGVTPTYGGYSAAIVVRQDFVLKIPKGLSPERAAPLLCAGITTYSPLKNWKVGRGHKLGVLGLGGLGHMAVKLGKALGAEVTVLSTSPAKEAEARRLGAARFVLSTDEKSLQAAAGLDFIIDTVSAPHDVGKFLGLLKRDGTMILVGASPEPLKVAAFPLIMNRRRLAGSLIGGIKQTQEMLDFCGRKKIQADVEVIPVAGINAAYDRVVRGDVRYRFVVDMATLSADA